MSLLTVLILAAALIGIGLYGALSQQSFVMLMMGFELMLNGVLLAVIGFWSQLPEPGLEAVPEHLHLTDCAVEIREEPVE